MSVYSKKIGVFILNMIKLLMTVITICFPAFMEFSSPFALVTPLFLSIIAFGGVSKGVAIIMLAVIVLMVVILLVLPVLLLVKKQNIKWITIVLQVFAIVEAVCLGVTFVMGGVFLKLLGVIMNVGIAVLLSKIRQEEIYSM